MYGPLEYVVIGFDGNRFTGEILPKLIEIERQGCVRLVDLVFVSKDEASNLTLMEISELGEEDAAAYEPLINEFHGLLSAEDVARAELAIPEYLEGRYRRRGSNAGKWFHSPRGPGRSYCRSDGSPGGRQ